MNQKLFSTSFRADNAVSRINYLISQSTFGIFRNQKTIIPYTTQKSKRKQTNVISDRLQSQTRGIRSHASLALVSQGWEETHFLYKVANIFRSVIVASISKNFRKKENEGKSV